VKTEVQRTEKRAWKLKIETTHVRKFLILLASTLETGEVVGLGQEKQTVEAKAASGRL
jgi:hypothetical protein